MPRGERERPASSPEPEDKLQAALQTLETGIDSILSSEGFARYLSTMARFHSYSASNIALVLYSSMGVRIGVRLVVKGDNHAEAVARPPPA